MNKPLSKIVFLFAIIASGLSLSAQQDSTKTSQYDGLSLQELLNVKIVSVSKKAELLFDAPLSASVVTKEDMQRAGCTSIMEALRLVPGMIVREQTNGNYDIYLRGMSNVPPNAPFDGNSTTTLVMIDNRPIYNYFKGGTFWETLPVDLNDVEKIEVIRGPAAALYGPNAVSGVINIITRHLKKEGVSFTAHASQGSYHTIINNATVGYRSGNWSILASGNYQNRDRAQTSYYEINSNRWLDHPDYLVTFIGDTIRNISSIYPDQELAMKKYGANIFMGYESPGKIKVDISTGIQHSHVQKVSTDNGMTPLTNVSSNSRYADMRMLIQGFTVQLSYNTGTQSPDRQPGNTYDFSTFDGGLEYNYTKGNFSIKPGISYRSAVYDDTKYSDTLNKRGGVFNSRAVITTASASLRGEYKLMDDKIRLVAGVMANKFNYPDTAYLSYEFAGTYKLNKKHLLRAVYSRAPRSANVYDTYVNQQVEFFPIGIQKYFQLLIESNKNIKLLTADMLEIGYRGTIAKGLYLDAEIFGIHSKNYSSLITGKTHTILRGADTIVILPYVVANLPAKLQQLGITVSLTYSAGKLQVKPFVTFQHSGLKDYAAFLNTPDATPSAQNPDPIQNNIYSGIGTKIKSKGTPDVFGGSMINYSVSSRLNINMSTYYYSPQIYYHASNTIFNDGVRGVDHIKAKIIVNTNVSYEPTKGLHLFCSGKNILNNRSREFFRSDDVPFMLMEESIMNFKSYSYLIIRSKRASRL